MIAVEYYPACEKSPLPNGESKYTFATSADFVAWVKTYVCNHCINHYENFHKSKATTLTHWLWGGCGCEIGITDENKLINWEEEMV